MTVESHNVSIHTKREGEIVDITDRIQGIIDEAELDNGVAFLFVPGSTGALTTIEYEPGLLSDFPSALERLVPRGIPYEHERRWHDGNGPSLVRASLLGPDLSVPCQNPRLFLVPWRHFLGFFPFVSGPARTVSVQLIGD